MDFNGQVKGTFDTLQVNGDIALSGQLIHPVDGDHIFSSNTFNFDCNLSMTQHVDAQGMTGDGTITFSNEVEGTTYVLVFTQGSGNHNISFPSGWWLNDTAFDFTTLGDNGRAVITAMYIDGEFIYSVKNLLYVA